MRRNLFSISIGLGLCLLNLSLQAQTWQRVTPNVPGTLGSGNIGPMATDGTRLYVLGNRGVFVSENGGDSFAAINAVPGAAYTLDKYAHRFVGVANGLVWVGTDPGSAAFNDGLATLHRLTPGQTTWTKSSAGFPVGTTGNQADDIAYDATTGTYYVAAALGGAFVSSDGANWEQRNNGNGGIGLPATVETINGTAFMVRPLGGINKTTDRGLTWTSTGAYPGPASSYLLALNGRLMIAVTGNNLLQDGLYFSDDLGATWTFTQNLPGAYDLTSDGNIVFAAGRGTSIKYSASQGLSWNDLPLTGTAPGFAATRMLRVGNNLFLLGSVNTATPPFTSTPELYRMDVSNFPFPAALQMVQQPVSSPVLLEGAPYTFKALAGGRNVTYQWQKDGVNIPGATSANLVFNSTTSADKGRYQVIVSDGAASLASAAADLNVFARIDGRADLRFVLDQPTPSGVTKVFSAGISIPLSDGQVVQAQGSFVTLYSATGKILAQRSFGASRYDGMILDAGGRIVIAGNGIRRLDPVTLQDDPTFPPVSGTFGEPAEWPGRGYLAPVGGSAVQLYRYDGTRDTSFNTALNIFESALLHVEVGPTGAIYARSDGYGIFQLKPNGETDPALNLPSFNTFRPHFLKPLRDGRLLIGRDALTGGTYLIQIYLANGTLDTSFNAADLRFNQRITSVAETAGGQLLVVGGFTTYGTATVGNMVLLNPDGNRDASFNDTAGFKNSATISTVSYDPSGYAYLSPSRAFNSNTFQDTALFGLVRVFAKPAPLAIVSVTPGQRVDQNGGITLRVSAVGTSALSYQWFKSGAAIPGATGPAYAISGFTALDNGSYTVEVRNASGAVTSAAAVLAVVGAPEITVQPVGAQMPVGTNHTFSVTATGAGTLGYQWRRNGANLAGATKSSLTLTNIQFSAEGEYSVVVSNAFGTLISGTATLTVFEITGALIQAFNPNDVGGAIGAMDLMPDGSLLLAGTFSRPGGQNHPWFTRVDANGAFVPGWTNDPPGGVTAGTGVYAVKALANGQSIIAGQFSRIAGAPRVGFARLNANGTVDLTYGHETIGPNSAVQVYEPLPDGRALVGGNFTQWGASTRVGLARVDANGLFDPTFTTAPNDYVFAIRALPDGRAYVAGRFSTIGGVNRAGLARLNADGSVDASFAPPSVDGIIYSLAVDGADNLLIGGAFSNVGGTPRSRVARLKPDGAHDTAFAPTATFFSQMTKVEVQLTGKILVVAAGNQLVRLLPDGTTDTTFQLSAVFNGNINTATSTPDGRIYLGGSFTTPRRYLAAVTTDKASLAITRQPTSQSADLGASVTFAAGVYTLSEASFQWLKNGVPLPGATGSALVLDNVGRTDAGQYSVRVSNDTRTIVSAAATLTVLAEPVLAVQPQAVSVSAGSAVTFTAQATGAGNLVYHWRRNGTEIPSATSASLAIPSASIDDAGVYDVVVSNALGSATTAPAGLGVFVSAGKLDPGFTTGTGPNNTVTAAAVLPNGNVIIGGTFNQVNGQGRNRLAMLEPNGGLVDLAGNPSFNFQVTAIAAQANGKFFVTTYASIGRYNSDGSRDTSFPLLGDQGTGIALRGDDVYFVGYFGQNPSVRKFSAVTGVEDVAFKAKAGELIGFSSYSLYVYPDGRVLVGDGNNGLRRLNADGSTDATFLPPAIQYSGGGAKPIYGIQVADDGKIWIGGVFTSVGGQQRGFLARLNPDGTVDTSVPDSGVNGQVNSLQIVGGELFVAGGFGPLINGVNYRGFVKVSGATGTVDPSFGPVLSGGFAYAISAAGNGRLILGGSFATPPGNVVRVVAQSDVALAISGQPGAASRKAGESLILSVGWKGGGNATYQWRKDDQPVAGATSQSLTIAAVTAADAGDYTVTVSAGGQTLTSAPARLTVTGGGGGNSGFAAWKGQFSFPSGQDTEAADADGDGLANVVEFVLGGNPVLASSGARPTFTTTESGGQNYPAVTFIRSKTASGATIQVRVSSTVEMIDDLGSTQASAEDLGNGTERVTIRSNVSASAAARQFLRVNVSVP